MSLIGGPGKKSNFGQDSTQKSAKTPQPSGTPTSAPAPAHTGAGMHRDPNRNASESVAVIQSDTIIKGEIRNCHRIEIHGYIEGQLDANTMVVHEDGKFYGTAKTNDAEVHGMAQGKIFVKNLINIHSTGTVTGNVQYGQLAMEMGANLSAEVRNVPPTVAGDFHITVEKGKSALVTTWDLTAFDPDDEAKYLTYTVSKPTNGFVALTTTPSKPIQTFTQVDLENKRVVFQHDGKNTDMASFSVVVSDAKGATSGAPQTVQVEVKAK